MWRYFFHFTILLSDWAQQTANEMQATIEAEEQKAYVDPFDTTQRLSYARRESEYY